MIIVKSNFTYNKSRGILDLLDTPNIICVNSRSDEMDEIHKMIEESIDDILNTIKYHHNGIPSYVFYRAGMHLFLSSRDGVLENYF